MEIKMLPRLILAVVLAVVVPRATRGQDCDPRSRDSYGDCPPENEYPDVERSRDPYDHVDRYYQEGPAPDRRGWEEVGQEMESAGVGDDGAGSSSTGDCVPLRLGYCEDLPYSATRYPNALGHTSPLDSERSPEYVLMSVLPQLLDGECQPQLRLFACAVLAPKCVPPPPEPHPLAWEGAPRTRSRVVRPCRAVCTDLRRNCERAFHRIQMRWPHYLECENHTASEREEECVDPTGRGFSFDASPHGEDWPGADAGHRGAVLRHRRHAEMTRALRRAEKSCGGAARLYSIGKSFENRDLLVIELSENPGKHELLVPEVRLVGNIHGNEVLGRELLVALAQHLCARLEDGDERVRRLLNTTRLHILPSMNPDGYELAADSIEEDRQAIQGRNNMQNIDLNRNFPDLTSGVLRRPKRRTQPLPVPDQYWDGKVAPETRAVIDWMEEFPFVLAGNLHGGELLVRYPYDASLMGEKFYSATPEDQMFRLLARTYAEAHPLMSDKHKAPCPGETGAPSGGIVNGAEWYSFRGGMPDFSYLHSGCLELTLELGCVKFPSGEDLPIEWAHNREALLTFVEAVHQGIKGVVRDERGAGIGGARISIKGNLRDTVTAPSGEFWRLLPPGSYIVRASRAGYRAVVKRVRLPARLQTSGRVDFKLPRQPGTTASPVEPHDGGRRRGGLSRGRSRGQGRSRNNGEDDEEEEKPRWWAYFQSMGIQPPPWMMVSPDDDY
uniref:Carboxypeptidase Z isoform X2 n=1 Tax=Petromyzon marinus TaxID=7757 RepID=A0AAJ7SZ47_PETMA|nr:carboxypeptidase Z isoform X2 [Petromyzon marinus]